MNKLEQMIKKLCPNGVEYKTILSVLSQPITDGPHETPSLCSSGIPFISVEAIHDGVVDINKCRGYISLDDSNLYRQKYRPMIDDVYMIKSASVGRVAIVGDEVDFDIWSPIAAMRPNKKVIFPRFLFYVLQTSIIQKEVIKQSSKGSQPNLSMRKLENFVIPVPPLEVQVEIVKILDEYTESVTALQRELEKELTARKKQYEYYRDMLLNFGDDYEWRKMGSLFKIEMCRRVKKEETSSHGEIPFYQNGTLGKEAKLFLTRETYEKYRAISKMPKKGAVMLSTAGTLGRAFVYNGEESYYQDSNIIWLNNDESVISNAFLLTYCRSFPWKVPTRGTLKHLHNYMIEDTPIPIPPIEEQERIVSILDRFDKLCNDISEGLPAEIEARRKQYEYYRDKLLSFEEVKA